MRPTYTDEPSASPLMREEDAELDAIRLYYLNGLREYQHFKKLGLAHLHNAITRAETRRLFPGSGPLGDPTPEEASARLQVRALGFNSARCTEVHAVYEGLLRQVSYGLAS
jgi:hypothetical protein